MNTNDVLEDMKVAEGIAKALSPFDTGNLRFNAIKSSLTNDGFRVVYSLADAYYIYFLEEGTQKSTMHQGFIANRTVPTIASFISAKYKQRKKSIVSDFKNKSLLAYEDRNYNWIEREQRNLYSKNINLDKLARENEWEHNTEMEIYDENFESRRL